jgi:CRISPR/Cas system-associated protein endoribonuclease Cas2
MKKIIIVLLFMIGSLANAQTQKFSGKVLIGNVPEKTMADSLLVYDSNKMVKHVKYSNLFLKFLADLDPYLAAKADTAWVNSKGFYNASNFIAGTDYQTPLSNVAFTNVDNDFNSKQTILTNAPELVLRDVNATNSSEIGGYFRLSEGAGTMHGYFGMASDDIQIWSRNGEINLLKNTNVTGNLDVAGTGSFNGLINIATGVGQEVIRFTNSVNGGYTSLYSDGSFDQALILDLDASGNSTFERLMIRYSGVDKFNFDNLGSFTALDGDIKVVDNNYLAVGNDRDLRLWHTGTNSYIDNKTGDLYIRNQSHGDNTYISVEDSSGQVFNGIIIDEEGGKVKLQYNNSQKLATTNSGIDIDGILDVNGDIRIEKQARPYLYFNQLASGSSFNLSQDDTNFVFKGSSSVNKFRFQFAGGSYEHEIYSGGIKVDGDLDVTGTGTFYDQIHINKGSITGSYPLRLTSSGVDTNFGSLNGDYFHIDTQAPNGVYFYDRVTSQEGFSGNGSQLTDVDATTLNTFTDTDFVRSTGNVTQIITGEKTFNGLELIINSEAIFNNQASFQDDLVVFGKTTAGTSLTIDNVADLSAIIKSTNLTNNRYLELPNADGTFALLSDIGDGSQLTNVNAQTLDSLDSTDFVRSTGNVTQIITGEKTFNGLELIINSEAIFNNQASFQDDLVVFGKTTAGTSLTIDNVADLSAIIKSTNLTNNRYLELPNADGTFALLSDIGDGSQLTNVNAQTLDSLDSTDFMRKTGNVTETITGTKSFSGVGLFNSGIAVSGSTQINDDGILMLGSGSKRISTSGKVTAGSYNVGTALNTAPASATATGTAGEIRYTADYIYVCVATNTWKRTALSTW